MPLLKHITLDGILTAAIWKITEPEEELRRLLAGSLKGPVAADAFKNESRRKQWMASRILVSVLAGNRPVEIGFLGNGKPVLKNSSDRISVSHSGDVAAAALSPRYPVGIDIEQIRERVARVAGRFLNETELPPPDLPDRLEKLHVCWGAKESLFKLNGDPGVDFRKEIIIHSFDYLCTPVQTCQASMTVNNISRVYPVYYEKIDDYMLVFTYDDVSQMTNDLMT